MEERRDFSQRGGLRGRRETGGFVPKPVEVGKEYEADIQEVSRRGEGIARIEGLVIFVPNAKQGEHVKIKVTRINKQTIRRGRGRRRREGAKRGREPR